LTSYITRLRFLCGPSSMEKGKLPQRCPSISSTQSSIDSPPPAHTKLPKATPPPYYSSAKSTSSDSTPEFDRTRDLAAGAYGGVRTRRPPSFCRRHWFIITVALVVVLTCGLAVLGVMLQGHKAGDTAFLPSQLTQPAEGDDRETFSYFTLTDPRNQDSRTMTDI
jgi:hypothetical protein